LKEKEKGESVKDGSWDVNYAVPDREQIASALQDRLLVRTSAGAVQELDWRRMERLDWREHVRAVVAVEIGEPA
jgi:hypothetical protein